MTRIQPVLIQVSRAEIEHCAPSRVIGILSTFVPELCERNRNRIRFEVMDYDNDSRELYDVPEVRNYFRKLFDSYTGMFYWVDFDSYMYVFLALMIGTPRRMSGGVTVSSPDITAFLSQGCMNLNSFCAEHALSPDPTNELIDKVLRRDS